MSTPNSRRITLEIEVGADPIRGVIEHPDGRVGPFWGWLDLLEELGRVATDAPERAPPGQLRPTPDRLANPPGQPKSQPQPTETEEMP